MKEFIQESLINDELKDAFSEEEIEPHRWIKDEICFFVWFSSFELSDNIVH